MGEPLMQVVILYFFFFAIVTILFRMTRKRSKSKIIVIIYIFLLLSPGTLYIPVEVNTYLYGAEFQNIDRHTGWELPVVYYKVFSIDENEATLFCVEGEGGKHQIGFLYTFVKTDGAWELESFDCVWTNLGGSASEFTIPPIFDMLLM